MRFFLSWILASLFSCNCFADGFDCRARHTGISFQVRHHDRAGAGTRRPEFMTVSDPLAPPEFQCRLVFRDENRTLNSSGPGKYRGRVDLRSVSASLRSEYLAGTRIEELSGIFLEIPFSYRRDALLLSSLVPEIPGKVVYERRNGERLEEPVSCTRIRKDPEVPPLDPPVPLKALLKVEDTPYTGSATLCRIRKKNR